MKIIKNGWQGLCNLLTVRRLRKFLLSILMINLCHLKEYKSKLLILRIQKNLLNRQMQKNDISIQAMSLEIQNRIKYVILKNFKRHLLLV